MPESLRRKDPFWITATALVVMLVGARLVRAYTPLGHNVFVDPFDPFLLLSDVLIHLALFFGAVLVLRAVSDRRASAPAG